MGHHYPGDIISMIYYLGTSMESLPFVPFLLFTSLTRENRFQGTFSQNQNIKSIIQKVEFKALLPPFKHSRNARPDQNPRALAPIWPCVATVHAPPAIISVQAEH